MKNYTSKIKVTKESVQLFKEFSHDLNPLHLEAKYASMTPFGKPVVYGIAVLLFAFGKWDPEKKSYFKKLNVKFRKPIYSEEEYELHISDDRNHNKLNLKIVRADVLYAEFSGFYEPCKKNRFPLKLNIKNPPNTTNLYKVENDSFKSLIKRFSLEEKLSEPQILFLCWTSFLVGMDTPGKRALYTQLSWDNAEEYISNIQLNKINESQTLGFTKIIGEGGGLGKFSIKALHRPIPIKYSFNEIRPIIPRSNYFSSKTFLITGATRGLGAVLAKALALTGANLILTYLSNKSELEEVIEQIYNEVGDSIHLEIIQVNLLYSDSVETLGKYNHQVDYVINNATGPIRQIFFKEMDSASYLKDFLSFYNISLNTIIASKTMLKKNGVFINISSVFASRPEAGFSAYISSKCAIEGLLATYSLEEPNKSIVNFRLPRILTDQTNSNIILNDLTSPIEVVAKMVNVLKANIFNSNFEQFEL